jgi:RNA polymerase sigma-70 factor (sigma-E family)
VAASARDAFGAYAAARLPAVRRTAYLLCGDWHTADDLAQSALIKLYLHWRRVERSESLDAYVRTIVVRLWLDQTRTSRWRREHLVAAAPDGPAQAASSDDMALLRIALDRLTTSQRAVLVLRFWEDLDVCATAAVLGVSEGTVKSQTSKALVSVRRELAALGVTGAGLLDVVADKGERR